MSEIIGVRWKRSHYYIVTAKMRHEGMTPEGADGWLAVDGPYSRWCGERQHAYRFDTPEAALRAFSISDGMPWHFRPKPETVRVIEVREETIIRSQDLKLTEPVEFKRKPA